jgi:DNA-binding MarR family transcriptional regulator
MLSKMDAGRLHRLARVLREIATQATADPDEEPVPASAIAIIEDIADHPGSSIGDIARRTHLAQSLVSTTVASMRQAGVVSLTADPADRRRVLVGIDAGARSGLLQSRAQRPVSAALRQAQPELSPGQLAQVERTLERLAQQLLD